MEVGGVCHKSLIHSSYVAYLSHDYPSTLTKLGRKFPNTPSHDVARYRQTNKAAAAQGYTSLIEDLPFAHSLITPAYSRLAPRCIERRARLNGD